MDEDELLAAWPSLTLGVLGSQLAGRAPRQLGAEGLLIVLPAQHPAQEDRRLIALGLDYDAIKIPVGSARDYVADLPVARLV